MGTYCIRGGESSSLAGRIKHVTNCRAGIQVTRHWRSRCGPCLCIITCSESMPSAVPLARKAVLDYSPQQTRRGRKLCASSSPRRGICSPLLESGQLCHLSIRMQSNDVVHAPSPGINALYFLPLTPLPAGHASPACWSPEEGDILTRTTFH